MANTYGRRLEKLETTPQDRDRFADVALHLMRYEIERRSLGWAQSDDDSRDMVRIWDAIQHAPGFAEMDAAVRGGERLICQPTVQLQRYPRINA
jgi:hypothetical protein